MFLNWLSKISDHMIFVHFETCFSFDGLPSWPALLYIAYFYTSRTHFKMGSIWTTSHYSIKTCDRDDMTWRQCLGSFSVMYSWHTGGYHYKCLWCELQQVCICWTLSAYGHMFTRRNKVELLGHFGRGLLLKWVWKHWWSKQIFLWLF